MKSAFTRLLLITCILALTTIILFADSIIPKVHADYCSGTIQCGKNEWVYRCSISGEVCPYLNVGFSCGLGKGTCGGGANECNLSLLTMNCNALTNQSDCVSATVLDCASRCSISAERPCSWITCSDTDQGCAAYGCAAGTRRICNNCTGCQCVTDSSCGGGGGPTSTPGGPTPTPTPTPSSCIVTTGDNTNCGCVTVNGDPNNLVVGNTYTFTAGYDKATSQQFRILSGTGVGCNKVYTKSYPVGTPPSFTWTPDTAGAFTASCRSSRAGVWACSGNAECVIPEASDSLCAGPAANLALNVVGVPTPTPVPGTIKVRAMVVSAADTSCTAIRASATGVTGTVQQFSPSSTSQPTPITQSGTTYATFSSVPPGSYTLNPQPPAGYVFARSCWADALSATAGEGISQTLAASDTVTWDVGYTVGSPWAQIQGGDIYASATLRSYIPVLTSFTGTGGTITTSGGYTTHTFTGSGTFTPNGAGNVEVLVVGGGGGGGVSDSTNRNAGGGGGGGVIYNSSLAVTAGSYPVTVGPGGDGTIGSGAGGDDPNQRIGGNSIFSTITASGGGGGGSGGAGSGGGGGSGGGAGRNHTADSGTGISGQGNNGGVGAAGTTVTSGGGGGGGAGSVGSAGTTSVGGAGGSGYASSISGSSFAYGGGGGGGRSSGSGGAGSTSGGAGAGSDAAGTAGTANTGGGGGGSAASSSVTRYGGNGGSGVVIIRYPTPTGNRSFILDGTGGYPGVATYGQNFTFDGTGVTLGQAWASSKNWLVNDTARSIDYYQLMYTQFGGTPATVDYVNPVSPISKPSSRVAPYYVTGDMTTSGNWVVANGNYVFIVNGNLTIAGTITITGTGFVSFIVNGDITIAPAVGGLYTSSTPVVEGVYITSPGHTFSTGVGSTGHERFVGRGIFIAGNFLLQRDIGTAGNPTISSELFIYNPQLLLRMPEAMKQMSVSWQEVAP